MQARHVGLTIGAWLIAGCMTLVTGPLASADPEVAPEPGPALPAPDQPLPDAGAPDAATDVSADGVSPSSDACKKFSLALNYAASNYEDFAYNSAGGGNAVNYGDPTVHDSNVVGRTALREAAATAMSASMTPGLQPDISSPMQSWSLRATKLVLVMGLRGGGDSLNSTANDLNTDAHDVQMACALAGTPA